ncbi:LacI family DNA-binding transcriptional regulator [Algivirga pacifica]|uniref:LacI family DNA-binding transcriptional regulator n=1 Tax=Algivirga pacifica TaxID=1162670 RepID=A0ABP9D692_9BACT
MKKKRTTIKDLARRLDISVSTVSRALRDAPDINPATRQEVLDLAQKLNYKRSTLATSLVSKRTFNIGVIVPELSVPFFGHVIAGIQETLLSKGYQMMICQSSEKIEQEQKSIELLMDHHVDGILISPTVETNHLEHIKMLKEEEVPVVLFDRTLPEANGIFSSVTVDDEEGAFNATTHLIHEGYQRIAHISGPKHLQITQQRLKGYKEALRLHNLPYVEDWVVHGDMHSNIGRITQQLLALPTPPDAIFAINDPVAFQVLHTLLSMKIDVPKEIGVVGYTGSDMAKLYHPTLSTVRQPAQSIGKEAALLLLEEIDSLWDRRVEKQPFVYRNRVLPTELVVGQSSRRNF